MCAGVSVCVRRQAGVRACIYVPSMSETERGGTRTRPNTDTRRPTRSSSTQASPRKQANHPTTLHVDNAHVVQMQVRCELGTGQPHVGEWMLHVTMQIKAHIVLLAHLQHSHTRRIEQNTRQRTSLRARMCPRCQSDVIFVPVNHQYDRVG